MDVRSSGTFVLDSTLTNRTLRLDGPFYVLLGTTKVVMFTYETLVYASVWSQVILFSLEAESSTIKLRNGWGDNASPSLTLHTQVFGRWSGNLNAAMVALMRQLMRVINCRCITPLNAIGTYDVIALWRHRIL
jgi:hypothetical protein